MVNVAAAAYRLDAFDCQLLSRMHWVSKYSPEVGDS